MSLNPRAVPHHLVAVWNPSYAANAMEEHLALLLDFVRRARHEDRDLDDAYVWWGKVHSANRQTRELGNEASLRELAQVLERDDHPETHLYLTDYRSLYVGELVEIVEGELDEEERDHAPRYYFDNALRCDFWFRVFDVRCLVRDDLDAVIRELALLRNTHYNDRPVSLYGGMVNLPLVVTRSDGRTFFDPDERERLIGKKLWAEFDAESGEGIAAMQRELRDDLVGERAWVALEPEAQLFIAAGDRIYRDHRHDFGFDFAPAMTSFAKAVEVQCDAVLRRALPQLARDERLANVDGRTVDLAEYRALSLGELAHAMGGERDLNAALASLLENGSWFTGQLPAILNEFSRVRNPGAHAARIDRATASQWRNRLLGVGCVGDFVELAKVRVRDPLSGARS